MLRLVSKITLTQQGDGRDNIFILDFVNEVEIESSWQNFTDTAKIIIPRNLYVKDENGQKVSWVDQNLYGSDDEVVLKRGDKVKIELGYRYFKKNERFETVDLHTEFEGYISSIINRAPLEIQCEDNMYKLKQVQVENKVWPESRYDLQSMLSEMLEGTGFTIKTKASGTGTISTKIGDFRTQDETVADVLARLRDKIRIESYFRGTELRCSGIVYYPEDAEEKTFKFQNNIISDRLEYRRVDDYSIGVKAFAFKTSDAVGTNKDGSAKKKKERLEAFCYYNRKKELVVVASKPNSFDGEVRTLNLLANNQEELERQIKANIHRVMYDGYRGSFETFGLPSVKHGDKAVLINETYPELGGTYMVKSVTKSFGMNGYRQSIEIDLRIDTLSEDMISQGL